MLIMAVFLVACVCARYGAVIISMEEIFSSITKYVTSVQMMELNERIFFDIRLPRVVLCIFVGASLAVGGTLMQALFLNPIVEPGLIGTSSGAAFGSACYIVLGATLNFPQSAGMLSVSSALGAALATSLVFVLASSRQHGKSAIVSLLLTGLAVNALFMSGVAFLSYIARDPQARSITFWSLGTLSGANWMAVWVTGMSTLLCIGFSMWYAKHLNALMIGASEAQYLGVNVRKLKTVILTINIILVAVATSFVGIISFVGLIVPHMLRMIGGSDNRFLIIRSALMGAVVLSLADLIARLVVRPAELPIGIVTSIIGVPVFIYLLRKRDYLF